MSSEALVLKIEGNLLSADTWLKCSQDRRAKGQPDLAFRFWMSARMHVLTAGRYLRELEQAVESEDRDQP